MSMGYRPQGTAEELDRLSDELTRENIDLRAQVERLTAERDEARAELADLKADDDAWQKTYETTHAALLEVRAEVAALTAKGEALVEALKDAPVQVFNACPHSFDCLEVSAAWAYVKTHCDAARAAWEEKP